MSPKVPLKLYGGEYMLFTERRIVPIRGTKETQKRAAVVDGSMIVIPEKLKHEASDIDVGKGHNSGPTVGKGN